MPIDYQRPFGLREIDITPIGPGPTYTLGTPIKLPAAQTMTFSPAADQTELRGDDAVVEVISHSRRIEWSLAHAGISLAAYAAMSGGTVATTGTGGTEVTSMELEGTDFGGYFRIRGRLVTAQGDTDTVVTIQYARATSGPNGNPRGEEFYVTEASGLGIAHPTSGLLLKVDHRATAAALAT